MKQKKLKNENNKEEAKERFREYIKNEKDRLLNDPKQKKLRKKSSPIMAKVLANDYPILIEY